MQPLKRFTQCGSLTMLFGVFIILFGVSSTALTTFGKTNSDKPAPTPIIKGKECNTHDDCLTIDKTSCVKDPNDYKQRCLCGDDTTPVNGHCQDVLKSLRHKCNSSNECEDGLVCQFESVNRTIGVAKFISKTKICLCDNDSGYFEDALRDICSGASQQTISNFLLSLISTMTPFFVFARMKTHF
ncbi:uncharacterized protein sosie [Eurosta solidaginis]|uniref:uncharacterized protein sosie n=1 Tax=Eurosta solidaginis TaxID=178769 RepID=UPI003531427F